MASAAPLSREEMVGLLLAGTAHVVLAVLLVTQRPDPKPYTPPERITVSLAEDVGLDSAAPDPSPDPAAAMAPELAPLPQPPVAAPPPPPVRPTARPTPTPTPRATRTARPTPAPTASRSARPTPTPSATRGGASQINENFLDGTSDATGDRGQAADRASPQQRASIESEISRQLKPHWVRNIPRGPDVERLVTKVRIRLNRDGSLNGPPLPMGTVGDNDINRAQMRPHQEAAIRAVRLAAPFDLPERFFSVWQDIEIDFDFRLAQ